MQTTIKLSFWLLIACGCTVEPAQNFIEIPDCIRGTSIQELELDSLTSSEQLIDLFANEMSVEEIVMANDLLAINDQNPNLFVNILHQTCDHIPAQAIEEIQDFQSFSRAFHISMYKYRFDLERKFAFNNKNTIQHYPTPVTLARDFNSLSEKDLVKLFDNYFSDFLDCNSQVDFDQLYLKYQTNS